MSVWIKTSETDGFAIVSGAKGGYVSIMKRSLWFKSPQEFKPFIKNKAVSLDVASSR